MTIGMLDVSETELAIVRAILERVAPGREVWAFGSRVTGRAKKFSDLDLTIVGEKPIPPGVMAELADAFSESDLPWKVDVVDWATASERFRGIVKESHVEL
jgi:predicted nucleotidyltransferase